MRHLSAPTATDSPAHADIATQPDADDDIGYEAALPYLVFDTAFTADASTRPASLGLMN